MCVDVLRLCAVRHMQRVRGDRHDCKNEHHSFFIPSSDSTRLTYTKRLGWRWFYDTNVALTSSIEQQLRTTFLEEFVSFSEGFRDLSSGLAMCPDSACRTLQLTITMVDDKIQMDCELEDVPYVLEF